MPVMICTTKKNIFENITYSPIPTVMLCFTGVESVI